MRKMSTAPSPICPKFVSVEGGDIYSRNKSDGIRFRFVSYNILAQAYVKSSFFPHSPSPCLKWKARSRTILSILRDLKADFLCLQEVDEYDAFYKGNMEAHGYSSIYIKRSGSKRDGCGIFYKQNCAELLVEEIIEYNDLADSIENEVTVDGDKNSDKVATGNRGAELKKDSANKSTPKDCGDINDPCVRLTRDCVGIMAAFKLNNPFPHIVVVANTHLYWDPELADVKLAQAKYLLSRLSQFKTTISDRYECMPSVIVAGDFNSVPRDKVYQYLTSGGNPSAPPVECLGEVPIPLCSVYAHTRGEPAFTNCTPDFTDTLDYIFFSPSDNIKPVGILELPDSESPGIVGGLPNNFYPSDHLPVGAEFEITRE
ncbi:carbon catabolite repressor protein 4 4 isoform X2 [Tripterygium wilfordii]|uniref:Carbon catabolite repressor protein 4 4 isoform X2 n=2 Tax=Tripterygium wilfordii TaxID=458696 RepID=A0A7J7BW61_TRIWF|nr:carbon catabolite repressor protein 4 4 isoform X2 [Tripterygium wilfordii]